MNNRMFPKMEKMQKLNIIIKCMTRGRKKGNVRKIKMLFKNVRSKYEVKSNII